jgi:hypothetical protein
LKKTIGRQLKPKTGNKKAVQLLLKVYFLIFLESTRANATSTTMTTTIIATSSGKADDFSREGEVAEGEELAEEGGEVEEEGGEVEEEGELEGDDEGVWDAEGEDELEVATTLPFTTLALISSEVSPVPG